LPYRTDTAPYRPNSGACVAGQVGQLEHRSLPTAQAHP
jgi:hypothetical protein